MLNNTAAAGQGFYDGWDDEEPTVVDSWCLAPGGELPPTAPAPYAGLSDDGIRAAFRSDPSATYQDLTAVGVSL